MADRFEDRNIGPEQDLPDVDAWRRTRRERRRSYRSPGSRLTGALILIVAGIILFLDNIGLLRVHDIWQYWPVILIAAGIGRFSSGRYASDRMRGVALMLFGALFLLVTTHVIFIHSWSGSWPVGLLLIALGCAALLDVSETRSWPGRTPVASPGPPTQPPFSGPPGGPTAGLSDEFLHERCFAGSVKRRLDTPNFKGGSVNSVLGSVEIDLRYAQVASNNPQVQVDVYSFCGAAKFRIPETWTVTLQAAAVLGNVEDKTIPPRTISGMRPQNLLITGEAVLGSIEVEN